MTNIRETPARDLERAIGFNKRDKTNVPTVYLDNFLRVAREFGYATQDDSWGELEKCLQIAFRNLVQYERAIAFIVECMTGGAESEQSWDALLDAGELNWQDKRDRRDRLQEFLQKIRPIEIHIPEDEA